MDIVTGDRYLEYLVKFVQKNAGGLIDGTLILKLNPVGLHYVQSRLEALRELEGLIAGAPVDYLRAYVSDLGDHRALEQLRRILCRLSSLKIVSVLSPPSRDPTPLSLLAFGRLKVLELRGCDLSTSTAKGLLELRHTLEKLICHNSTDALRHVFASRIADIKESAQWNRLSLVSCACNGLILMDESLQLLPAVETLDLSRNKFAKVDNLRKCTRLTHLDLGFNQLRSVASFSEVTCHILKLVLRSNALSTLRGIENLKSLDGLDVSYNIISNYGELEVLSGLPSLKNIWLEGNPLCCARWYRPQVFSYFLHPEQVKLDDKEMSTKEFWKRQIIIARRQRRPASYGFYFPAREENEVGRLINGKTKKLSRLACIESEELGMNMIFEQDSLSCDNDMHGGEEDVSDKEGELSSLINRIESMKKERPKPLLEEFKDLMDQGSENGVDEIKNSHAALAFGNSNFRDTSSWRHIGESSRYMEYESDSIINSEDDRGTNAKETNSSLASSSAGNYGYQWLHSAAENGESKPRIFTSALDEDLLKFYFPQGKKFLQIADFNSATSGTDVLDGDELNAGVNSTQLTSINSIKDVTTSSGPPVSPPHYEEDILCRRHYLEEEFFQVSAESLSAASSDSNTSCDEEDGRESMPLFPETENIIGEDGSTRDINGRFASLLTKGDDVLHVPEVGQGWGSRDFSVQQSTRKLGGNDCSLELCCGNEPLVGKNDEDAISSKKKDAECHEKKNPKRKPKKRVVSLSDSFSSCENDIKDGQQKQTVNDMCCIGSACGKVNSVPMHHESGGVLAKSKHAVLKAGDHIEDYFNSLVADTTIPETCKQYIICNGVVGRKPMWSERQVAVVLSSEWKLYVILLDGMLDGSGDNVSLLISHKVEDVSEVLIGLGLLVIWVYIDEDTSYLLITRCKEKTMHLLFMIGLISRGEINKCSVRSLDQLQLNLFDRQIGGSSGISIYQYCMVLFWHNIKREEDWVCRSLFVIGGHLVVCIEDFFHFSSLSEHADAASYFLLDTCCSIANVSEMVIETKENLYATLTLREDSTVSCLSPIFDNMKLRAGYQNGSMVSGAKKWKMKWFSAESLSKFVTLVKAIHRGMTIKSVHNL
ncbi:hypothetical protein SOVF_177000 isoform B [Spinacia oleracea]|uniref:Uncharacterized protein isoform X2 n=1 Tax=Spinacia oleracea TaxID=3562 RepID=A0A9R0JWQ9_SPIOL|nr:uncharacterized protein LOC110789019 isoform X2 [Spinacia oleracea]KNA06876.1 hypothetical protein SOVF_177000 isoform B [Spinacia oleracea]